MQRKSALNSRGIGESEGRRITFARPGAGRPTVGEYDLGPLRQSGTSTVGFTAFYEGFHAQSGTVRFAQSSGERVAGTFRFTILDGERSVVLEGSFSAGPWNSEHVVEEPVIG